MKEISVPLEVITPCFCGGADPTKQAEIRAPSIRGQFRWWFRVLGGFKSIGSLTLAEQEARLFGSTAGGEGQAGKLLLRVRHAGDATLVSTERKNLEGMGVTDPNQPLGYFLFPLRSTQREGDKSRAVFKTKLPKFDVLVLRRGNLSPWQTEADYERDVNALLSVFGHLGALGFRSRRAMGALALPDDSLPLEPALGRFGDRAGIIVRAMPANDATDATTRLARWLKNWRSHGRTPNLHRSGAGFHFARRDHNEGSRVLGASVPSPDPEKPAGRDGDTFRPALGLPIMQFFSSTMETVQWHESFDPNRRRERDYHGEGRFASPVILRPHRCAGGSWRALVIFVEARKWLPNKPVYLEGQQRTVSLTLYDEMKRQANTDPVFSAFP